MNTYKRLYRYTPEVMHYLWVAIVFSIIAAILSILPYYYFWNYLNELVIKGGGANTFSFAIIIVGMLLAYVLVYLLALWMSHLLGFRMESNMRKVGTKHMLNASWSFFDTHSSGYIRKLIDDNAGRTHMLIAHLIPDITVAIIVPLLMLAILAIVDWKLAILFIAVVGIGLVQYKGMMGDQVFMKQYTAALERMNSETVEYVRGMQVLKIFNVTVRSLKSLYESIKLYADMSYNYTKSCRSSYVSFQVVFNLFIAFTVPLGIILINRGVDILLIAIECIFFALIAGNIFTSFMKIMYTAMYDYHAQDTVDKLETLFSKMDEKKLEYGTIEEMSDFDIEFKNVSFKYDEDYVIQNLSLKLEAGKTYALVGASGGGKSTIAKLLSGFYKIEEGEILIGGHKLSDYTERAVCRNIANVFQNAKLFKMSIYDNVKLANPNAKHDEIMRALSNAGCDEILDKFEKREHTMIGADGVYLSGGETQRIAIARAILKDAPLVILDEASAAADPENEYEIQCAFTNLMRGKTVIMIAHRLTSIRGVDEILVVDNGNIIERGSHNELMSRKTKYRELQELFAKSNDWRIHD